MALQNGNYKWFLFIIASQLPWVLFTIYNVRDADKCRSTTVHDHSNDSSHSFSSQFASASDSKTKCIDCLFENPPSQDNEDLIQLVRDKYIFPPDFTVPYKLSDSAEKNWDQSRSGIVPVVRDFLQNITKGKGFFIECGANDGEFITNTLWFERALGWNGLLIEAEPLTFEKLKSKHRRAWISNVCLSPSIYPEELPFYRNAIAPGGGRDSLVKSSAIRAGAIEEVKIKCFPLYTLLAAINVFHVDFFLLDIEGIELKVLQTIPFDKISFKVLMIEVEHMILAGEKGIGLHKLMKEVGYTLYKELPYDRMYVHSSLVPKGFVEPKI